jgi:large subunit ribosomal protein L21
MYAVFETGGKQFRAEPGFRLRVPSIQAEPGDKLTFDQVLLAGGEGDKVVVGTPMVEGATVTAEVIRHARTPKIIVFKRKKRKNYRRKQGHRQGFTEIRIDEVAVG